MLIGSRGTIIARLHDVVGLAARNLPADVSLVQQRLTLASAAPGPVDGVCGRLTLGAIIRFQRGFLREPDARVEVNGPTWRRLDAAVLPRPGPATPPRASTSTARRAEATPTVTPPASTGATTGGPPGSPQPLPVVPADPRTDDFDFADHLPLPPAGSVNVGLRSGRAATLTAKFGAPRASYTQDCLPPAAAFAARCSTRSVGPFRVTGLTQAVDSLVTILNAVRFDLPDLHRRLSTAGMLCCRHQRGSSSAISNHSWGTAIDLKVSGVLVPRGARYAIAGLSLLAPYFNRAGWYWGATFPTPDPHHFECSESLIESWTA